MSVNLEVANWSCNLIIKELTDFVIKNKKGLNLSEKEIINLIGIVQFQTEKKQKKRLRKPAEHDRCIARTLKDGIEGQCSHTDIDSTKSLCGTHLNSNMNYDTIFKAIPSEFIYKFKTTLDSKCDLYNDFNKIIDNKSQIEKQLNKKKKISNKLKFKEIFICNEKFYLNLITLCVYSRINNVFYLIGTYNKINNKVFIQK